MTPLSFGFVQSALRIGTLTVDHIQWHSYLRSFLSVEGLHPSISCLCNVSTIPKRSAYFSPFDPYYWNCFSSHQLEKAGRVVLKAEYDLRTKEFNQAREKKEAESYSRDLKADVRNRASVSLPTIRKKKITDVGNPTIIVL